MRFKKAYDTVGGYDIPTDYGNMAGYGHGGLGWQPSLDAMPPEQPTYPSLPSWAPWVGLAGAGLLGYAGFRGLRNLFKRKPPTPSNWSWQHEYLGHEGPLVQQRIDDATQALRQHGMKVPASTTLDDLK